MSANRRLARLQKELTDVLKKGPEFGISCEFKDDSLNVLESSLTGLVDTPYENGVFKLQLLIGEKYPYEPPQIKFVTPIYHPNVDNAGRICLDLLKMPPNGNWRPTMMLTGVLMAIQDLLRHPNPEDPLVPEIAHEFKYNTSAFEEKARKLTAEFASH